MNQIFDNTSYFQRDTHISWTLVVVEDILMVSSSLGPNHRPRDHWSDSSGLEYSTEHIEILKYWCWWFVE